MSTRYGAAMILRMMVGGLLAATAAMTATPAAAHGGGRVFFGFGFGAPVYYPYPYYYPPFYYYPPPAFVAVPAYGTVQPVAPASPTARNSSGQHCREFQTTVQVDGQWQPGYGTACLQPDGSWRIVN